MDNRIRLTRLMGGEALRTDSLEGILCSEVKEGNVLFVLTDALDPEMGNVRRVTTSTIVKVQESGRNYVVNTASGSVYYVEYLDE